MNMGDDSRLMYDEIGERMEVVKHDLVNYFPFPDKRDERIRVLEAALRPFAAMADTLSEESPDSLIWYGTDRKGEVNRVMVGDIRAAADALAVGPPVMMVYVKGEGE